MDIKETCRVKDGACHDHVPAHNPIFQFRPKVKTEMRMQTSIADNLLATKWNTSGEPRVNHVLSQSQTKCVVALILNLQLP